MTYFRVWFKKVDEQAIDVEADNQHAAVGQARDVWRKKNGFPNYADIEIIKEE